MRVRPRFRMAAQLKQRLLHLLGLGNPAHPYMIRAHRLRRAILRSDERLRTDYLQKTTTPKLHIGGGWRILDGWLNTDVELIPDVMEMDATQRFPFGDGTFQYVYTEHMIEHVPYPQGIYMLRECHRVMRNGGVIRVITPDLAAMMRLYGGDLSADQKKYLSWFCQTFVPAEYPHGAVSTINAMFRLWGHQFIYDEATLADAMRAAGFGSVTRWSLGESDHSDLQDLGNERRYPEGLLNCESLTLEGRKQEEQNNSGCCESREIHRTR
jgi:predicted SAM-dependent methyltransferase